MEGINLMNLFKTFSLTWWQAGVFKAGMFGIGTAFGACLHSYFIPYLTIILAAAIACLAYVTYVWAKQ